MNLLPGLKANMACHIRGLEGADDKRGSPPPLDHCEGRQLGTKSGWGFSLAGVCKRE